MPEITTNPDVKEAFDAIKAKRQRYDLLFSYYRGLHPLKYSASRLRKAFEKIDTYFAENWIGVIVDSLLDRLSLKGFDVSENKTADDTLDRLWKDYNIQLISDDVHEAAAIVGEGFVIALPTDEVDEETPYDIYFNDPRMMHMFYEHDRPNKKRFAAKMYTNKDKYVCLTLYYADKFEYYISNKKADKNDLVSSWSVFQPDPETPEEPNEYGEIPVFHFSTNRVSKRRDLGASEISLQDAINKLFADMLIAAEFSTFTQRIIISQSDPGELQNNPNANWWIPAGDGKSQATQVMELGGKALTPYLEGIDKLATALAIISRTPKHYFFSQGGDPSGEALIAMEAPLNKKAKKRQSALSVEWQNFARFLLKLEKIVDVKKSQISPTWEPVETVQPKSAADTTKVRIDSGVPLVTALRWEGKTEQDITQMESDKKKEKKEMSGLAQDALDKLRAEDQTSNNTGNNGQAANNPARMTSGNVQNNTGINTRATPGNRS